MSGVAGHADVVELPDPRGAAPGLERVVITR